MQIKPISLIAFTILVAGLLVGCGEKENKNILKARLALSNQEYQDARVSVDVVLQTNPNSHEAKLLDIILDIETGTAKLSAAISKIVEGLRPINQEIQTLETKEDPDSDDLDQLEAFIRSRNAVTGSLAQVLKGKSLQPTQDLVLVLLEGEQCYSTITRQLSEDLILEMGDTISAHLTQIAINYPSNGIRKSAVKHLGYLEGNEFITVFHQILKNKNESPEVLYEVVVALERMLSPEILPILRTAIQTNSAQVRMYSARLIGQLKTPDAIDDLIRLFADSNSYVKGQAQLALLHIGVPSIDPLIEVLNKRAVNIIPDTNSGIVSESQFIATAYIDEDRRTSRRLGVQRTVIEALGIFNARQAIPQLIDLLDDDDLSGNVTSALIAMGKPEFPRLASSKKDSEEDLISSLINAMGDMKRSNQVRIQSAQILSNIGDLRAVETLVNALEKDPLKEIRVIAASAIGNMRARGKDLVIRSVEVLARSLNDKNDTIVINASKALGQLNVQYDKADQKLIEIAQDKRRRETVRREALSTLVILKPQHARQAMLRIMFSDDTSPDLRRASVKVLSEIGDDATKHALIWALSTRYENVRKFQGNMKRKYKSSLSNFAADIKRFGINWDDHPDYQMPSYDNWGELKPIPGLVRSEIAIALKKFGTDTEAVNSLVEALEKDERATVRKSAAWALGEIKGEIARKRLITALKKDKQGVVRQEAAVALGKIGGNEVVASLLDRLTKDKYETTRRNATIALREIETAESNRGLVNILRKGIGTFEEKQESRSVLDQVRISLKIGGTASTSDLLLKSLESEDEWVRWAVVDALGAIHTKKTVPSILNELKSESYIVRKRAVATLGNYKSRPTVEPLIEILNNSSESKSIRAQAAASLGKLRDERAIDHLIKILGTDISKIQLQAVKALGSIKAANSVSLILALLDNPSTDLLVREACVNALASIGDKSAEFLIIRVFRSESGNIFKNSIKALGSLKTTEVVPELIRIVEDLDSGSDVRKLAAAALASIEDKRAAEVLAKRLIDQFEYQVDLDVDGLKRNYTWESLVSSAKSFDLPSLIDQKMIDRIEDTWEDHPVQNAAIVALSQSKSKKATDYLTILLEDNNSARHQTIVRVIGEAGQIQFKNKLVELMKDKNRILDDRRAAIQGVGALADSSTFQDLIDILNDETNAIELRRDATVALGKIGNDQVISNLIDKLDELQSENKKKGLRLDIIRILAEAKSEKTVAVLEKALKDPDSDIHFIAADALFQVTGNEYGYSRL